MPWRIDTAEPLPAALSRRIAALVDGYDRVWSRFRPDSIVARIAREAGSHALPAEAAPLLGWYRELYEATGGRVSPLVGGALAAAGHGPRLAGAEKAVPRWEEALAWDGERLDAVRPVTLDAGAAGKGQLVDLVAAALDGAGLDRWLVDASGDLRGRGLPGLRVALEHPGDPRRAVGIAEPGDRALCASAAVRRDGLAHLLDAVTGLPSAGAVASWAVADTAMEADGAATALLLEVDPALLRRHRVEHARLYADGRFEVSPGFPGEVFA